jgi:hypothetical protein
MALTRKLRFEHGGVDVEKRAEAARYRIINQHRRCAEVTFDSRHRRIDLRRVGDIANVSLAPGNSRSSAVSRAALRASMATR